MRNLPPDMTNRLVQLGSNRYNLQRWASNHPGKVGVRLSGWTNDIVYDREGVVNELMQRLGPLERLAVEPILRSTIPATPPGEARTVRNTNISLVATMDSETFSIEFHVAERMYNTLFPQSINVTTQE